MIINVDKFVASLIESTSGINQIIHIDLLNALKEQGLEYKNEEIVKTQRRVAAEAKEAIFDDEDEMIRKRLLTDFSILGKEEWGGLKVKDICAWLEKQGEQKPILDFKASNWYVSKVDGKIHDLTYNPTDKKELKKLTQSVTKISDKVWSEEDEKIYNAMIKASHCALKGVAGKIDYKWSEIAEWLQSLKKRIKGE